MFNRFVSPVILLFSMAVTDSAIYAQPVEFGTTSFDVTCFEDETVSETFSPLEECKRRFRECIFNKNYTHAMRVLDEEARVSKGLPLDPLIVAVNTLVTRAMLYDLQGKRSQAVKMLSEYEIPECNSIRLLPYYYSVMATISLRNGDYDETVKIMAKKIDQLSESLSKEPNNADKDVTKINVYLANIGVCAYYRLLAKCIVTEGCIDDRSMITDYQAVLICLYCESKTVEKLADEDVGYLTNICRPLLEPMSKFFENKNSRPFRVIPKKVQPASIKSGKTKEDECSIELGFLFDIVYE
ncbi:MAG: hypothetical protein LBU65_02060 [Planctomycetaceae bacterium]|jgi:hypothetical protein|nr:hypothetical protein [Planctomycetaceae bacterium]